MSGNRWIDWTGLPELWASGMRTGEIAQRYGCLPPAVCNAAKRLGLPRRPKGGDRRSKTPPPAPKPKPRPVFRYDEVSARARAEGLTTAQAMQRLHRERASA